MRPLLLQLGPLKLYGYGAMIVLGGALSFWWLWRRRQKAGLRTEDDFWLLVNSILLGGFVGGRILFVFEYAPPRDPEFWRSLFSMSQGFSVLGAFAGVPLAIWLFCRARKVPFLNLMDHVCVMAPFWHVFGRFGCFLAGCCFGRPTTLPWAVTFTDPRSMVPTELRGTPLHPAQLYEAGLDLALAWLLSRYLKRPHDPGSVAAAYFAAYGVIRFGLETVRGDVVPLTTWLTAGQGLGLALIAGAFIVRVCFRPS